MSLVFIAQLLLGTAMLLALGFHRHRAALVCALLMLMLSGATSDALRVQQGALRFAPWLLLLSAAMPEARLLSRRHAIVVSLILILTGITLAGPPHVFEGLRDLAAWPLPAINERLAAALLCAMAGFACVGWWARSGRVIEVGLTVVLLLAAAGCAQFAALAGWFGAAALVAILAILYSSYRMAFVDTLTGLPNRRALDETLSRLSGGYALAMIDIDHFKSFNDTYGHASGDLVLRQVGQTLRRCTGGRSYRYGGEEFCVVFEGRSSEDAGKPLEYARRQVQLLRIAVAAPVPKRSRKPAATPATRDVSVTISAGWARREAHRRAAEEVLKAADQALYRAKNKGRNRVVAG
jgi:diguanylate cyclase (GGDEF)-like protein